MNRQNHNRGYTLLELMVVIAIMGILTTGALAFISYQNNGNVKKAAANLDAALGTLRICAMSYSGNWNMQIIRDSSNMYSYSIYRDNGSEILCTESGNLGNRLIIKKIPESGDTPIEITQSTVTHADISFQRSSGAVISGDYQYIIQSGNTSYTITLIKATGKHTIE